MEMSVASQEERLQRFIQLVEEKMHENEESQP